MTIGRKAGRSLLMACGVLLGLLLFVFLAVQLQQRTLRRRAERLSADMHRIRLYQTTWADAQHLMRRWGAWGHYDGSCTENDCKYEIGLYSVDWYDPRGQRHAWLDWLLNHDRLNLYQWFGGRGSAFIASFTVHNGTIWRESVAFGVSVPRRRMRRVTHADTILGPDDFDHTFSIGAASYQRLHRSPQNPWVFMGGAEQLAHHPYYKIGGPDGCMINCRAETVYFSTHTPLAEIEGMTTYDFSCLTRFHPCSEFEDLLPAAKQWVSHGNAEGQDTSSEEPCDIPAWAQARDARYVLAVEALSAKIEKVQGFSGKLLCEAAELRVIASLKEPAPWASGMAVDAHLSNWLSAGSELKSELFVPGNRYIVFAVGNDDRSHLLTKDSPITVEYCGIYADTPETRRELKIGFAQNDNLVP